MGARSVRGEEHPKSVRIINEGENMTAYQYTIKDNSVQVIGHERELVVYDFDNWKKDIIMRYRALLSMKKDVEYAEAYLKQMFFNEDTSLIDGALINSAIQLLVKCFSNPSGKGRPSLNVNKVFRTYAKSIGEEDFTKQFFQFYNARNEVISHDQSEFLENIIGLTVNPSTGLAVDIAEITLRKGFLYKQNHEILLRMVHVLLDYLQSQIEEIRKSLIEIYNDLSEKPDFNIVFCENIPMATAW